MITQRMMSGGKKEPEYWTFTVNTEATAAGEKTSAVPLNLYNQSGVTVDVDWGDGTTSRLTSADYDVGDSTASVHEYATAGIYTITLGSTSWGKAHILAIKSTSDISTNNNGVAPIYWFRRTLVSIDSMLPKILGKNYYSSPSSISTISSDNEIDYIFAYCNKLTNVCSGLFDNNEQFTKFSCCFYSCSALIAIPEHLFDNNTEATTFSRCFQYCQLIVSIPNELFKNNIKAINFEYCFYKCSSITAIPSGLFDTNTLVKYFSNCFALCSTITAIPSGLFDNNTLATNFANCFYWCNIPTIPSGLFDSNTEATNFSGCFYKAPISVIPENLFVNNTKVTNFKACFSECSNLTTIPTGIFDTNTKVTNFSSCFAYCSNLTTIPSGLFSNNTVVTDFSKCFYYISSSSDFTLHIGSSSVSSASDFVTKQSGTTRTVYVPTVSTTETTFNNVASSLGLTIIGE